MTNDAQTAALLARAGVPGAIERLCELSIVKGERVGWGLPDPYDAYSDGSLNPTDTIYAYTTAHAGIAFVQAGEEEWAREAAETIYALMAPSGLVWYSDQTADQQEGYECPNVAGIALGFLAQMSIGTQPLAMALLHWQGKNLARDIDYHPSNWRYRTGSSQCTDLYHETLIAYGLREAGEYAAAERSIAGMWSTHFTSTSRPWGRHHVDARSYWGPASMAVLTGDSDLLRWLGKHDPDGEGRDLEVAQAYRELAFCGTAVAA